MNPATNGTARIGARADVAEIERAIALLHRDRVFEVRALHCSPRDRTSAGYFDRAHISAAARAAAGLSAAGIYTAINEVNPELLSRSANRLIENPKATTADTDVLRRYWLPLDFDPKRPSGISSTDAEKAAALGCAESCREWLADRGWVAPVFADSGNGHHLLYPIDLVNDEASRLLIERVLKSLDLIFSNDNVSLDTSLFNAARIIKLYGTIAAKGDSTSARPHRLSRILQDPGNRPGEVVTVEQLRAVAMLAPEEDRRSGSGRDGGRSSDFDLENWLRDHNLAVGSPVDYGRGDRKWLFHRGELCPFGGGHDAQGSFVIQFASGAIAAGCHHNSCGGKGWADLRAKFEPGFDSARRPRTATTTRSKPTASTTDDAEARPPGYSDDQIADRFAVESAADLRYVATWRDWFGFDGVAWRLDSTLSAFDQVRSVCRRVAAELLSEAQDPAKVMKLSAAVASAKTVAGVHSLVRADRRLAATTEQWDTDDWALNTPRGTVDLRNGKPCPARREDYITKVTAVAPANAGTECPLWCGFLERIFAADDELIKFVQRVAGYCLTGSTRDHALFFGYGGGRNGKGVLINTFKGILGDYAVSTPRETFTVSKQDQHPTNLADLVGARLVISSETEESRRWDEARIKEMTGGDVLKARKMRRDFFEYVPKFKLLIIGNHKPVLRNVDEAIRGRFNLIPFTVTIPVEERDTELPEKLKAEWPAILRWMIDGCLAWQEGGLKAPNSVRTATDKFLADNDAMGRWLRERCVVLESKWTASSILFASFKAWAEQNGVWVGSEPELVDRLENRGFERKRKTRGRGFKGIELRGEPETGNEDTEQDD